MKNLDQLTIDVTQNKKTEPPFSGKYDNFFEEGEYKCIVCGARLFSSRAKYDSGCGWPAFYEPAATDSINYTKDLSHGMDRIEITCSKCGAHLGHVFPDGPSEKGCQRYCVNSVSLDFKKE